MIRPYFNGFVLFTAYRDGAVPTHCCRWNIMTTTMSTSTTTMAKTLLTKVSNDCLSLLISILLTSEATNLFLLYIKIVLYKVNERNREQKKKLTIF